MSERDDLAAVLHPAIQALGGPNRATGCGGGCKDVADAVLAAGWVPAERLDVLTDRLLVAAYERDALAATVQRVRALCERWAQEARDDVTSIRPLPEAVFDLRAALDRQDSEEDTRVALTAALSDVRRGAWNEGYIAAWRDSEKSAGYGIPNPYGDPFAPKGGREATP